MALAAKGFREPGRSPLPTRRTTTNQFGVRGPSFLTPSADSTILASRPLDSSDIRRNRESIPKAQIPVKP